MNSLFGAVGPEVLIILFILALLFGGKKLPKLGRSMGESLENFKKGKEESEMDLEDNH